ncbi:MAG TPA: hypothetical protein VJW76_16825 [Verrucomicrobiae bacterium]|nr:hypothetical protein [Verrucomicrobiae bacterium]
MNRTDIARRLRRSQMELRFWNHQWQKNRDGALLEICEALHRRTGCVKVMRKEPNHRFVPPKQEQSIEKPAKAPDVPATVIKRSASSPCPSPPSDGGEGKCVVGCS